MLLSLPSAQKPDRRRRAEVGPRLGEFKIGWRRKPPMKVLPARPLITGLHFGPKNFSYDLRKTLIAFINGGATKPKIIVLVTVWTIGGYGIQAGMNVKRMASQTEG